MSSKNARQLRKNLTDAERHLWAQLRNRQLDGFKFRRQAPIGPYIVDFICLSEKLIIEADGGQHAQQADEDAKRTHWLEERGYRVMRFWNNDILENIEGVVKIIRKAL